MKELGQLMTEAALPVLSDGPMAVRTALAQCLSSEIGLLPEEDLAALVALTEVAFLGVPEDFDPRAVLRRMHPFAFGRLCAEMDRRGDSSEGPFIWVQCERARLKGLHLPDHDWSFVRIDQWAGETHFYMKDKRSGRPLVVVYNTFGRPEDGNA